jgi:signal transduction histidine kinase
MWTGTAIQNALLQQQTKHLAVLEERERIGMDLHDGVIQSLYSLGLTLDYVKAILEEDPVEIREKLDQATGGINSTIADIRTYVSDLRPRQMKENITFKENLKILLEELEKNAQIKASLNNEIQDQLNLNYQNTVTLFKIAQESLSNTARHAQAKKTDLRLWEENGRIYLEILDDGVGFNIDKTKANLGHGLANMQRRSRKASGGIEIISSPGKGTRVIAWVPKNEEGE